MKRVKKDTRTGTERILPVTADRAENVVREFMRSGMERTTVNLDHKFELEHPDAWDGRLRIAIDSTLNRGKCHVERDGDKVMLVRGGRR